MEEHQSEGDESTKTPETLSWEPQCLLEVLLSWERKYIRLESKSKSQQGWIRDAIGYWKSLDKTEKKSILRVNTFDLDYFSCKYVNIPWLRDLLADVVTFRELYNQWDIYICPSPECRRWFITGDLLTSHLACEHLPEIHQTNAWPLQRDWTEEKWCAETLSNAVWKPIDVDVTFCSLYDAFGGSHDGGGLFENFPCSKDSRRSELLEKLGKGFQKLIEHQEKSFFSMLSNGRLRALIHLAANHILDPTSNITLAYPFRSLLEQSPTCFCFLEEEPLSCFVQLVDDMVNFVNQVTATPPKGIMDLNRDNVCDVNWSENGECLDALSAPERHDSQYYFELDEDKIRQQLGDPDGLPRWLLKAPCIPSIELLPAKASKIFHQVESKVKSFVNRLTIPDMQSAPAEVVYFELWSVMCGLRNRTYESLVDSPPSLLSTKKSNLWNGEQARSPLRHSFSSCFSPEELLQFRRTTFCSKMEPGYLELIKLSFELQCLKPQIQELCALDLRKCILPLIRSYSRMKLYVLVNVFYQPVEDTDVEESTEKGDEIEEEGLTAKDSCDETAQTANTEANLPVSRTGLETQTDSRAWSRIATPLIYNGRELSVSNSEYEDESASVSSWVENPTNHSLYLFLRERGLLETEVTGLIVWGSITDVIKHCVQRDRRYDALDIWERKTYRSLKYWHCCCCGSDFPYQERHMEHMECEHQLGFPHNEHWLMPVPHKQDEALLESSVTLDSSVTFDRNYNCFLVDAGKLCHMPSCNSGEKLCEDASLGDKVQHIKDQLSILRQLIDEKYELMRMSYSAFTKQKLNVNTEIVQCCDRIDNLKQDLSECCLSEYNILSPIGSFIKAEFGIKSVDWIASLARQRFEALLRTVTCSEFPSLKLELQSPGKVLIKIKEHGEGFGFAYVGASWKFNGEMVIGYKRTKRTMDGSLQMVASSNWELDYFLNDLTLNIYNPSDFNITLNFCGVNAYEMVTVKCILVGSIRQDVVKKLCEFEAEFAKVLKGI